MNNSIDVKDFKKNIQIIRQNISTYILAFAIHKVLHKNHMEKVKCDGGKPIGGYVYDDTKECFFINCTDWISIGYLPLCYGITTKDSDLWREYIPMPNSIVKRHFSESQKKEFEKFLIQYPEKEYKIQFLQFIAG